MSKVKQQKQKSKRITKTKIKGSLEFPSLYIYFLFYFLLQEAVKHIKIHRKLGRFLIISPVAMLVLFKKLP